MNIFLTEKSLFYYLFYLFQNMQVFTYMSYNKINKIFEKEGILFSSPNELSTIIFLWLLEPTALLGDGQRHRFSCH